MSIKLDQESIERIEKKLNINNWKCGNCEATGDSGVELLFCCWGYARCPECCSTEIFEAEEEEESAEEEEEEVND